MNLAARSFMGTLNFFFWLGLILFGGAGTFDYPQAWLFLGTVAIGVAAITFYLFRYDRALLERRMKAGARAETEKSQKILLLLAPAFFALCVLLPALAWRFDWPRLPFDAAIMGNALVAFGLGIVFLTFRANTFAGATVTLARGQKVIESGLYARVRHPMYSGVLLAMTGIPLALGSAVGFIGLPFVVLFLVLRLIEEEKFLRARLDGYADYCRKVRWRLIPRVF